MGGLRYGLISTTAVSASYRHVSRKIMDEFPDVLDKVSYELTTQRNQLRLSLESRVDNPMSTIESFNRQFQLGEEERKALEWAWPLEAGETVFNVINAYTRAAQFGDWQQNRVISSRGLGGQF